MYGGGKEVGGLGFLVILWFFLVVGVFIVVVVVECDGGFVVDVFYDVVCGGYYLVDCGFFGIYCGCVVVGMWL